MSRQTKKIQELAVSPKLRRLQALPRPPRLDSQMSLNCLCHLGLRLILVHQLSDDRGSLVSCTGRGAAPGKHERHEDKPGEECAVPCICEVDAAVANRREHDAGHDGEALNERAVSKERGGVHARERQRDGERRHRGDQRTPEMRQQLVEDEQTVGAFERREVLRVVQVERQSQTRDAETGERRSREPPSASLSAGG